ncbi:hypothetical protein ACIRPH_31665 [Nocardiopsis sp. NPDC101807]|uniref:hypothetical protein n=1 Tax=Nocardiopsis sp. NPDC101807 TaxID=3364339 RepID=UPI00381CA087
MIRLTHRRCRHEVEGLADAALRQTARAETLAVRVENRDAKVEDLTDDLRAAEHRLDEITAACEDIEYAREDAVIPDLLREKLLDADDRDRVLAEHSRALAQIDELTERRDRTLAAAHEAGMLARVYALMMGAGDRGDSDAGDLMEGMRVTRWHRVPGWGCQDTACTEEVRELVWHTDRPSRAHMACECGRVWRAAPGSADRAETESRRHALRGTGYSSTRPWGTLPAPVLEAMDRALPTAAEVRRAAAAVPA